MVHVGVAEPHVEQPLAGTVEIVVDALPLHLEHEALAQGNVQRDEVRCVVRDVVGLRGDPHPEVYVLLVVQEVDRLGDDEIGPVDHPVELVIGVVIGVRLGLVEVDPALLAYVEGIVSHGDGDRETLPAVRELYLRHDARHVGLGPFLADGVLHVEGDAQEDVVVESNEGFQLDTAAIVSQDGNLVGAPGERVGRGRVDLHGVTRIVLRPQGPPGKED